MTIPSPMKLNKFRLVTIPKNRKYFERFGFGAAPSNAFSGEEFMPSGNKTDVLQQMMSHYTREVEKSSE